MSRKSISYLIIRENGEQSSEPPGWERVYCLSGFVPDRHHIKVQTEVRWARGLLSAVVISHTTWAGRMIAAVVTLPRASGLESSDETLDLNELDKAVNACRPQDLGVGERE